MSTGLSVDPDQLTQEVEAVGTALSRLQNSSKFIQSLTVALGFDLPFFLF